ncbi:MAG: hypothetical protein ACI9U2_003760 [Bradymonadia bacterium]
MLASNAEQIPRRCSVLRAFGAWADLRSALREAGILPQTPTLTQFTAQTACPGTSAALRTTVRPGALRFEVWPAETLRRETPDGIDAICHARATGGLLLQV